MKHKKWHQYFCCEIWTSKWLWWVSVQARDKILVPFFKFHQTIKVISGTDWNSNIDQTRLTLLYNWSLLLSSVCVYGGGDRKQQMKVCTGMLLSSIWFEVCLSGLNMHLFFRWRWNNHSHSWTIEWSHWSQLYRSGICNLPCPGWSRQNVGHGFRASN